MYQSRERARKRKGFAIRKDGHVFLFLYPRGQESAAVKALAGCSLLDPSEVLALACYLGQDPGKLGLTGA